MTSECTLQVRTYECDSYKHVNNANYLNYLEYARYEYLKDIGFDYEKAIKAGYGVYIARIEIDYKMPAFTDDTLVIKSKPVKKRRRQRHHCTGNLEGRQPADKRKSYLGVRGLQGRSYQITRGI
uniref:Thioesterase family protein n=1 Tax=uncultured bacterium contig00218 TaxID=1181612 RepID=A0A806K2S9_9BACT|nr:thioesterase family protein [uncultured bacterium contig00218]